MDMDQAAVFLAGTILTVIGCLIALGGILVANNLIATYWKTWGWKFMAWAHEPQRFMTAEEEAKIAPILKDNNGKPN
jgi:hypothetical protein